MNHISANNNVENILKSTVELNNMLLIVTDWLYFYLMDVIY